MKMADKADKIAMSRSAQLSSGWDALRDIVDLHTDSELDVFQLDLLTDMVADRLQRPKRES